jgi:hypothetical protein
MLSRVVIILNAVTVTTTDNKMIGNERERRNAVLHNWGLFAEGFSVDAGMTCGSVPMDNRVSSNRPGGKSCCTRVDDADEVIVSEPSNNDSCSGRPFLHNKSPYQASPLHSPSSISCSTKSTVAIKLGRKVKKMPDALQRYPTKTMKIRKRHICYFDDLVAISVKREGSRDVTFGNVATKI